MRFYDLLTEFLSKPDIGDDDLMDFASEISTSPKTPIAEKVQMGSFNAELLREIILSNIVKQCIPLRAKTWKMIREYIGRDFSEQGDDAASIQLVRTHRIFLQIFVHFTKMDVKLEFEAYVRSQKSQTASENASSSLQKPSQDAPDPYKANSPEELYDLELLEYMEGAMKNLRKGEIVQIATENTTRELKRTLSLPSILSAFSVCINDVLTTSDDDREYSDKWIREQIDRMIVYTVSMFAPRPRLAGAVLLDGMLISAGTLVGASETDVFDANLVTLACHECGHLLDRNKFDDFNFSSPWKYLPNRVEKRFDLVNTCDSLEIGRNVELLLFEGIQPLWRVTNTLAAATFLSRLTTIATYPIIKQAEHKTFDLLARSEPSTVFGVDIMEEYFERFEY